MGMTESEALKYMKLFREDWDRDSKTKNAMALDVAISALSEIQQYRAIGTVSEFRELKEKATAKKLKHGVCPKCSTNNDMIIKNLGNPQGHKTIFCWNCGSCIDWSKGKE